jgi:predicted nucleic acid-binding protein
MPFVVDASAALAWFFADERTADTQALLLSLEKDYALTPAIWPAEMANAFLMAERRKRISADDTAQFLSDIAVLPLRAERALAADDMAAVIDLARRHTLSAYDASYLDVAMRRKLPLATRDADLAAAAASQGVKLLL